MSRKKSKTSDISVNDIGSVDNHPNRKAVYAIVERENAERDFWLRIGTAFVNRDNSLTVYLNALPTNSKLHIRDFYDQNK